MRSRDNLPGGALLFSELFLPVLSALTPPSPSTNGGHFSIISFKRMKQLKRPIGIDQWV